MVRLQLEQRKFSIRKLIEHFVESTKIYFVIKPLQKIYCRGHYNDKLVKMRKLPKNTVGYDIARMLDEKYLKLIPKFENHDLKHLVLGYEMTAQDEIKMQAYLFGNGNRSFSCILFLSSGILFPSLWREYYQEYRKGKNAPSILDLSIDDCVKMPTNKLKEKYKTYL